MSTEIINKGSISVRLGSIPADKIVIKDSDLHTTEYMPLFYKPVKDEPFCKSKHFQVRSRTSDKVSSELVGVVGQGYVPIPNSQVTEITKSILRQLNVNENIVEEMQPRYSKHGAFCLNQVVLKDKYPAIKISEGTFDSSGIDKFYPAITTVNSYDGSSGVIVELGFWREICANGILVGQVDTPLSKRLYCRHGQGAIDRIAENVEQLTMDLRNSAETCINYLTTQILQEEAVLKIMGLLPKRAVKKTIDQFNISDKDLTRAYTMFNLITYIATHQVKAHRQMAVASAMRQLININ